MNKKDIFSHLDMSANEARVYKALLHIGTSSVTAIMKHSKLHRPSTYRAIASLIEKDLISTVPKGKRCMYTAMPPSLLRSRLKDELERVEEEIPRLEYLFEKKPQKPVVTFVEGKQAVAQAYLNIPRSLKKGDIFYRYSARDVVNRKEQIEKKMIRKYQEERDKKQLERYVITSESNYRAKKPRLEQDMKMVPPDFDLFDHDVAQVIYGNNILLIDYNSNSAILIENPTLAHFQRRLFQLLYKLLP